MREVRSGPSLQLQRRKSAPRRQLKRKMGEVTRKTEHWSSSAYGIRQHIKKNPLIQCAGQMFPVRVFTGNAHLFPSEMSWAALLRGARCPACTLATTVHRKQWWPLNAHQNTTSTRTDCTPQFYANPCTIIINNVVKMLNLQTTFCQRRCFNSALIKSDSRCTAWVSKTPAKQEMPQSNSFSFLHRWQLMPSPTTSPLRHVGQPGVTHLDDEVKAEEGYVTFRRSCGYNKLLKSNPKPINWTVFPLPSAGPGLTLTRLKYKYYIFPKLRY